jgi:hypothetical protein
MLTCCCQTSGGQSRESTADGPDACCSFEHLVAGWPTAPTQSRVATPPTLASVVRPLAATLAQPTSRSSSSAAPPAGEPPPIWRRVLRV